MVLASLLLGLLGSVALEKSRGTPVPVLMYHHFAPETGSDTVVTPEQFRRQMTAIKEAGFTAVTLQQMLDYVEKGTPLPEKPVLITMDDGYTSNLTLAAPILEELGLRATIFVIGVNEGQTIYLHSGNPLYPERFSYEEAAQWVEKGVLDLQCHTFDMHQLQSYGFSGRDGMLALAGESAAAHRKAIEEDLAQFRWRREGRVSTPLCALAYPYGYYDLEIDGILAQLGYTITFTTDELCSRLKEGDLSSLRMLGRFNVTEHWSGEDLVRRLEKAIK